jgi:hypothetical protein
VHDCFTSGSRHWPALHASPSWPMCGRLRCVKDFECVAAWSWQRCVRPFSAALTRPLALMPSGDQVPVKASIRDAMAQVGCPDHRFDRCCITCCQPSPTLASHALAHVLFSCCRALNAPARRVRDRPRLTPSSPRPCAQSCSRVQRPQHARGAAQVASRATADAACRASWRT